MGKKRKHAETEAVANEETAMERPKRTLLGFKDGSTEEKKESSVVTFRNKEKVLVTCSRRISYRFVFLQLFRKKGCCK